MHQTVLPEDWFVPFRSDVPALLVSGDTDPASPPRWGEAVHAFLPNSRHLVVPGGHVPGNACTGAIAAAMFRAGSTQELDLGCVSRLRYVPFELPPASRDLQERTWARPDFRQEIVAPRCAPAQSLRT